MPEPASRVPIIVAFIGVVGTVTAAVVANWDKLFHASPTAVVAAPAATAAQRTPAAPPENSQRTPALPPENSQRTLAPPPLVARTLSGTWRDAGDPATVSTLVQDGRALQFRRVGVLANGIAFESNGNGTVDGQQVATQYVARYQNGSASTGHCAGSVNATTDAIVLRCSDSWLGTFDSTAVRR